MSDLDDYDDVVDAVAGFVDVWSNALKDVAKRLADIKAELDRIEALGDTFRPNILSASSFDPFLASFASRPEAVQRST
jgi:hypothetical protein